MYKAIQFINLFYLVIPLCNTIKNTKVKINNLFKFYKLNTWISETIITLRNN